MGTRLSGARMALAGAILTVLAAMMPSAASRAQDGSERVQNAPGMARANEPFPLGAEIYNRNCAACHDNGAGRAPQKVILTNMRPEAIRDALTIGSMRAQGSALSEEEKIAVAQHLSSRKIGAAEDRPEPRMCSGDAAQFDLSRPPAFTGWGFDAEGTHAVDAATAGIARGDVSRLKLKWAFGFPDANRVRSQPALAGGAIFVGSHDGRVFALDRETGCARWIFQAASEVRTGIILSPWDAEGKDQPRLAFFGDWAGNAYALEALTGKLVWKIEADSHPSTVITGTPALHNGTLYVPVSSLEEGAAASPDYPCCTFRGSILALDAATGATKWRTYLVGEPVRQEDGSYGPSGVAVWSAPIVDTARSQLYITTGDNYTHPTTELSDAIVALDLESGTINWHYQATEGDAWNVACVVPGPGNCPEDSGPDFDFGASAILAKGNDGADYVLAGQKSGIAYAVDPDTGELVWKVRLGRGGVAGGIHFGIAASEGRLFVPVSDMWDGKPGDFPLSPGLYALDIATGERIWSVRAEDTCDGRRLCLPGYAAAITVTPEQVFAGADDGHMRIFDAADGSVLWDFDTARTFETVNTIPGRGGAGSAGAAPIVHEGQLIVSSGYGFVSKLPGNVLLVFEVE